MNKKFKGLYDTSKTTYITNKTTPDNIKILIGGRSNGKTLKIIKQLLQEKEELKQALIDIREYVNSDKLLKILCEPKINIKGETHFDLIRKDILQIIDKVLDLDKVRNEK